jgi:hypothetical protein
MVLDLDGALFVMRPVCLLRCHYEGPSLCSCKCLVGNRGSICTNSTPDGHEEAKGSPRASHILPQGPHDTVGSRAVPKNVDSSEDEADNDTDRATHHGTHLHLVDGGGSDGTALDRYRHGRKFKENRERREFGLSL